MTEIQQIGRMLLRGIDDNSGGHLYSSIYHIPVIVMQLHHYHRKSGIHSQPDAHDIGRQYCPDDCSSIEEENPMTRYQQWGIIIIKLITAGQE